MVVSVNSDSLCLPEITFQGHEVIENLAATAEHRSRNLDHFVGQVRQTLFQHVQDAGGVLSYAGKLRLKFHIRQYLRRECRIVCGCTQRQMEFRGPAPQGCGSFEVQAEVVTGYLSWGFVRELQWTAELATQVFRKRQRCTGLVVAVKLFQGPLPAITFVCHQTLQHCQTREFAIDPG